MTAIELQNKLGKEIAVDAESRGGRHFVIFCFTYPNGDSLIVYVINEGGKIFLSDLGTTSFFYHQQDIELEGKKADFFRRICRHHDLESDSTQYGSFCIIKETTEENAAKDALKICEAILKICSIFYVESIIL